MIDYEKRLYNKALKQLYGDTPEDSKLIGRMLDDKCLNIMKSNGVFKTNNSISKRNFYRIILSNLDILKDDVYKYVFQHLLETDKDYAQQVLISLLGKYEKYWTGISNKIIKITNDSVEVQVELECELDKNNYLIMLTEGSAGASGVAKLMNKIINIAFLSNASLVAGEFSYTLAKGKYSIYTLLGVIVLVQIGTA